MSQAPLIDDPVALAKRILRNETAEAVLPDRLAREMFTAEAANFDKRVTTEPGRKIPSYLKLFWLAMCLKKVKQFSYARKILYQAQTGSDLDDADQKGLIKIFQQRALCTYKDAYLSPDERLDAAIKILNELKRAQTIPDQETLGLRGGIYKRKWEADGNKQHLEMSLSYYRQGYEQGINSDYGYTAINAAFVLDLLANLELEEAKATQGSYEYAKSRIAEASEICVKVRKALEDMSRADATLESEWWFLTTLANACFGHGDYDEADKWLEKANALREQQKGVPVCSNKVPDWELESTSRQLALLARVQEHNANIIAELDGKGKQSKSTRPASTIDEESAPVVVREEVKHTKAWEVLRKFLGNDAGVQTAYIGKVGLALSGGGFRASLFHIGVLARLAELDVLRHVEVLSCVSGGSIIGAYYYLEVRKRLRLVPDRLITREHYIRIVKRIEKRFLDGVKKNIRTRIASNPLVNLKMMVDSSYSRTERAGELYESLLYALVKDGQGKPARPLRNLTITPKGEAENFSPKLHNWRRRAKAPILILNATTLNTGHNWHFTTTYMGESPASIIPEIDGNCRLRRMYYKDEAPEKHRDITLGTAVAASACVPALFEPIVLDELYEKNMTVRLVDGGVHDNQGIAGLLEQDCTVLLVSDASGQTETQQDPSRGLVGVSLRSNNILMARVREAEYRELAARRRSLLLSGLMYIHLRKDINVDPVNWRNCKDRYEDSDEYKESQRRSTKWTGYGISKKMQEKLALIRTDLDSFSEVEAYSLMASGYYMTGNEFPRSIGNIPTSAEQEDWQFLRVRKLLKEECSEATQTTFEKLLEVGQKRGFKVWYLNSTLRWLGFGIKIFAVIATLAAVAFMLLIFLENLFPDRVRVGVSIVLGGVILLLILTLILGRLNLKRARQIELLLIRLIIGLSLGPIVWLAAGLHLLIFNRGFLKRGSLDYLQKIEGKPL